MNYKDICYKAIEIIKEVGVYIKKEQAQIKNINVESKGKNDFVTIVDKTAEQSLVSALSKILLESGFIAEEQSSTKRGEKYNWIIDPLDGTTNYIHNNQVYAISVALQENEKIVIGIVYEIGLSECFYAWKNSAAYLNGEIINVSKSKNINNSLIATGFPYYNYQQLQNFLKTLEYFMRNSHGIRRLGSAATDLAYVACGRFDAFYEYNLNAWDVAAGAFIVQQAGGTVSDYSGKNNYLFGKEIIASNKHVYQEFFKVINQYFKLEK